MNTVANTNTVQTNEPITKKSSVYDILDDIVSKDTGFVHRMSHKMPDVEVVKDRRQWLVNYCKDKVVLDIGSAGTDGSGLLYSQMAQAAERIYGIDKCVPTNPHLPNIAKLDVDKPGVVMPFISYGVEVIVAGEVMEHMTNPGCFLENMKQYAEPDMVERFREVELVITVPNAFSAGGFKAASGGTEIVNDDHTCWFSPRTLKTLLSKTGWNPVEWRYYGGSKYVAEGIIVTAKASGDPEGDF